MGFGWLRDIAGGILGFAGADRANDEARAAAERQMAFQREVMQNRYQWQVDDLRKAGLNPVLATSLGAGTASGATYTPENTTAPIAASFASAAERAMVQSQIDNQTRETDAKVRLLEAQASDIEEKTNAKYWPANVGSLSAGATRSLASAGESRARTEEIYTVVKRAPFEIQRLTAQVGELRAKRDYWFEQIKLASSQGRAADARARYDKAREQVERWEGMIAEEKLRLAGAQADIAELQTGIVGRQKEAADSIINRALNSSGLGALSGIYKNIYN